MTKATAQKLAACVSLTGLVAIMGVRLYAIGWLDDWRVVAGVGGVMAVVIGGMVVLSMRRGKREAEASSAHWEERRAALTRMKQRGESRDDRE